MMNNSTDLTLEKRKEPFVATKIKVSIYAVSNYSFANIDEFCQEWWKNNSSNSKKN